MTTEDDLHDEDSEEDTTVSKKKVKEPTAEELKDYFKDFEMKDVFVNYDFPRVFWATNPKGEVWIFKWCDTLEKTELWLAFQVSEKRLNYLREGSLSLLEAIGTEKGNLYLYASDDPFSPEGVEIRRYGSLPSEYLPRTDVSFKTGKTRSILRPSDQLGLRLHIITENDQPLKYVEFPSAFQEYISLTAHKAEGQEIYSHYSATDWSILNVESMKTGSFDLDFATKNPDKIKPITTACNLLLQLVNTESILEETQNDSALREIRNQMGDDGFFWATSLLTFIKTFDLSLSLRWESEKDHGAFLALDKEKAIRLLKAIEKVGKPEEPEVQPKVVTKVVIEMNEDQLKPISKVTLKLTEEEVAPLLIKIPDKSHGGMQSLLRELQVVIQTDNTITLTPFQIERIIKYTSNYGSGGFQGRLRGLARALRRVGVTLAEA